MRLTFFGSETKRGHNVFWLFFKIDLTISLEISRRDLSNDVAEHRSILIYNQISSILVLIAHLIRMQQLLKTGVSVLLCR